MHDSAFEKAQVFRRAYLAPYEGEPLTILDVGSAVVADGHRSNKEAFANPGWRYVGLDLEPAPNVDLVVEDPYDWRELADASVDVVACSQVLEHTEFFWITILEIARVLRPGGLAFIVAPGSGPLHRYPVDCWRFYDDGLPALARWGDLVVLEARVQWRPVFARGNQWRDAAAVLQRPIRTAPDETAAARKIAMVKAVHQGAEPSRVNALGPQPGRIRPSDGKDALAAHEDTLARGGSALAYKARLVGAHLRGIRRVLTSPACDIRSE
jgi:SAM-dependent methyltransferase